MPTLAEFMSPETVRWLVARDKPSALNELIGVLASSPYVRNAARLRDAVIARETMMSTGVGYGVAVPHAKIPEVEGFIVAVGILPDGVPYESPIDDLPVKLICMIAGPDSDQGRYLKILSTVMKFLKSEKGRMLSARHPDEVVRCAQGYILDA